MSQLLRDAMCDKKIIIIGAGISGISAGAKLMENNFTDITILEAENRFGGRIYSIDFGGDNKKIDLGGQWVQGQDGNVVYEMTKDHVEFQTTPFMPTFFYSNGSLVNQEDSFKLLELSSSIVEEFDEMRAFNGSFGEFFNEKYSKALNLPDYSEVDMQLAELIKENMQTQQNAHFASKSWFDVSSKLYADLQNAAGDQSLSWKDKGFITVVDYITVKKSKLLSLILLTN